MKKPNYLTYAIKISIKRSIIIEHYLDEDVGKELCNRFTGSKLEGEDTIAKYYIVRGCVAVQLEKDNDNPILFVTGLKGNLEKVLDDIKKIAPELKSKQIRA